MHLTDHISDVQLNEYLDHETSHRAQIESHLAECAECASRLSALQTLFAEIESLPEVTLTRPIASRLTLPSNLPAQLPRSLTLTVILQAALALVALIIAAPLIISLLPTIEMPSLADILTRLQSQWITLLNLLSTLRLSSGQVFHFPTMPALPPLEISSLVITLTLAGVSTLWLVGNGLLLRNKMK